MRSRTDWKFSEAALRVDFVRIVREAERAVYPAPCLLRVTVDNDPKQIVTLVHSECFEGFIAQGAATSVDKVLDAPRLIVNEDLHVMQIQGNRGVIGRDMDAELAEPTCESQWFAIQGDFVGVLSDRVEVKVEVF